jgi:hypothetical protein
MTPSWKWQMRWCRLNAWIVLAFALCATGPVHSQAVAQAPDGANALRERHQTLQTALRENPFGRALHLDSTQTSGDLKGEIHAVVEHPFETVRTSLRVARHWCDILILHLNVKQCLSAAGAGPSVLAVHVGRKFDQPLEEAYRVDFAYSVVADSAEFLHVALRADNGPLGTRDYRITLRAIPLGDSRTFLNLSYAYGYGVAARLAMQAYLSTLGSDKVGFSVLEKRPDGQHVYVGSVRGVVERNTMRYYLAIDTYLGSLGTPPAQQAEQRLRAWFAATERYARQLHEMDEADYLTMKRKEIARKPSTPAPAPG